MSRVSRAALRVASSLALAAFAPSARGAEPLDVQPLRDGAVIGTSAGLSLLLALEADRLTPNRCRFCDPNGFDRGLRSAFRWDRPNRAAVASDVVANGLLPAALVGHAAVAAWGDGGWVQAAEDLAATSEAVLLSIDLNLLAKGAAGRVRPGAWSAGTLEGTDSNRSFYSGHTALAFSLASAAGTVSTLRGYRSAPWVWAIGMTLASSVAYLRVAADAHWATDVLTGAAIGGAIGFAVPWTLHRPAGARPPAVQLMPAPGGFALRW